MQLYSKIDLMGIVIINFLFHKEIPNMQRGIKLDIDIYPLK